MIRTIRKNKVEYGDFQTPLELAKMVCKKLVELRINPDVILDPTCGVGNFLETAALCFPSVHKIIGVELNSYYLQELEKKDNFKGSKN